MEQEAVKDTIPTKRTEEVTDIIERMPVTFAKRITALVCFIFALIIFFGYIVKYPDIVTGEATISAEQSPLQLVAEQSGRLRINQIKSQDSISSGQLLAWIDNPAHPELVQQITELVKTTSLPTSDARKLYAQLPKSLNLGDLTIPYSSFISSIKQLADYQINRLYDKQEHALSKILNEQQDALKTLKDKEHLSLQHLALTDKFLERDSILLAKKIISQAEFEQSIASRITAEDHVKSSLRSSGSIREQISSTENSIQETRITKSERELQLDLEVLTSFNNLIDKINLWEKQYLIRSPITGKAQFLKFWNENQFVQAGEPIFSIVPKENSILGKVQLPISGAGKVKVGQEVIVKLADYPYMEYGYIKATVRDISLVSSPVNTGDGTSMDSYLVTLSFPNELATNYGTILDFKFDAKGTAEIITKDRRLIERFFDNLKYIGHSK
ncbi:HlyD family efflux transporter periplasmic adaptor subunit [Sphingobacterium alkalisoli]|uniref:HlyD family efflux transporter periplasmic adaptor subunit n=1 Tax=Sphingobacterium alkalisoli TaxID=1874115 RepID=A0A4U0H781_9SPHI|nr:HlyD family efflux transporter periplasmic adaptor subunit [Sphingobacterium alkalisoli]TJY67713.1 HlyD family efflux transporter periplasmic adaptor subunit [Sphingobacterium alkalisoli]GGH11829.1 hemolysin D [Sphingobacterium alkalisoli]